MTTIPLYGIFKMQFNGFFYKKECGMKKTLSRRDFLKGSAAGAAALTAAGLFGSAVSAEEAEEISWDREYDVVIAGAGGTGVSAAAAAKEAGAGSVIVFEKSGIMGGKSF